MESGRGLALPLGDCNALYLTSSCVALSPAEQFPAGNWPGRISQLVWEIAQRYGEKLAAWGGSKAKLAGSGVAGRDGVLGGLMPANRLWSLSEHIVASLEALNLQRGALPRTRM